ncbi:MULTISPECIES: GtrA family protein [Acetobacter]|uniref:GtrA family protein n=1 Tax=Acetobacter TaxID=434 RepID=UPI00376FF9D2
MLKNKETLQHLFRFLIVGAIGTIVNYLFFLFLLKEIGWQYQIDAVCGFLMGVLIGFPLNKAWTYESRANQNDTSIFYKYVCVYLFSLVVNFYVLGILVTQFNLDPRAANGLTIIITTIINFLGTKLWVFRSTLKNNKEELNEYLL